MKFASAAALATLLATADLPAAAASAQPHNVIVFVADGLRYVSVTPTSAPALWRIKTQGVDFTNSHALYPTITTVNASAIATGHYIGDTGNFGNALFSGFDSTLTKAPIAALEDDGVLGEMNAHFGGNYLNETSLLAAAREAGYATAVVGKVGPTAIQDVTQRDGTGTIVIDDAFNTPKGLTVTSDILNAIKAAGLADKAPKTNVPNNEQQQYMIAVATKVVLPKLASSGKPFAMLYWSRDPDATQHSQKDGVGSLTPGINGPTGRASIKDADDTLAALLAALKAQGLDKTTDIFVTADHGFSTIDRMSSRTSPSAKVTFPAGLPGETPSGFLAMDLADVLGLKLIDPATHQLLDYKSGKPLAFGTGFLSEDGENAKVLVVANGGSDLIYVPGNDKRPTVGKIVDALTNMDTISGIFVNDPIADIPGALPMSAINWRGTAKTPHPDIVVSFASHPIAGCKPLLMCAAEMADTSLSTGQGMHGTFSRADTRNFQAAIGPDFKSRYADPSPISNADINPTLAHILGLTIQPKGGLTGRVITEALKGGKPTKFVRKTQRSSPAANGKITVLEYQDADGRHYFDAAGFLGHTVGLDAK